AQAHLDAEGQAILEHLVRDRADGTVRPVLGRKALREGQSLLLPVTDPIVMRDAGLDEQSIEDARALQVRSVMSGLLEVRGATTGVLTLASTTRRYDNDDLRFAESYAERAALMLANMELYAQARDAIVVRDEFLSLAAHELRTPLMSLTLSAAVLAKE